MGCFVTIVRISTIILFQMKVINLFAGVVKTTHIENCQKIYLD